MLQRALSGSGGGGGGASVASLHLTANTPATIKGTNFAFLNFYESSTLDPLTNPAGCSTVWGCVAEKTLVTNTAPFVTATYNATTETLTLTTTNQTVSVFLLSGDFTVLS